jgi:hypothetical protein
MPEGGGSVVLRNTGECLLVYDVVSKKTVMFLIKVVKTLILELKIK